MKLKLCFLGVGAERTPLDDKWLVEYDPCRDGVDADGEPMSAHVVVTDDFEKALDLPPDEIVELWQKVDEREPVREDGRPNKPLTAYTVEFVK